MRSPKETTHEKHIGSMSPNIVLLSLQIRIRKEHMCFYQKQKRIFAAKQY